MLFAVFVEKTSGSAGPKSKSNREGRSSDASQAVYEARTKLHQAKMVEKNTKAIAMMRSNKKSACSLAPCHPAPESPFGRGNWYVAHLEAKK